MMPLDDALAGATEVGLDTAPIIYLIEANPKYDALVTEIFRRIDQGILTGFTSVITLTEVLTQPLQQNQTRLQEEYRNLLLYSANFHTLPINERGGQSGRRPSGAVRIAYARCHANCASQNSNLPSISDQRQSSRTGNGR